MGSINVNCLNFHQISKWTETVDSKNTIYFKTLMIEKRHLAEWQDNLGDYVGKPVFTSDKMYENTPPGMAS